MKPPVVTGQQPQKPSGGGAKAKPKAKVKLIQKKSEKYKGVVNYRKGADGKLIPVSLKGGKDLPKKKASSSSSSTPPAAATDTTPGTASLRDPGTQALLDAMGTARHGEAEGSLARDIGTARTHNSNLDGVFDAFHNEIGKTIDAQRADTAGLVGEMGANATAASKASGEATAPLQQGQAATDALVGTSYAAELAHQAGAGAQANADRSGTNAAILGAVGEANKGALQRTGANMETERVVQHAHAIDTVNKFGEELRALKRVKGAERVTDAMGLDKQKADAIQQAVDNQIKIGAITAGDQKSIREFKAKMAGIQSAEDIAGMQTQSAEDIAAGNNKTAITVGAGNNKATTDAAETSATAGTRNAKIAARATVAAARIRGQDKNGAGGDGSVTFNVDGKKVKLSAAERKTWSERRHTSIAAYTDLRTELVKNADKPQKAIDAIKSRYHLSEAVVRALIPATRRQGLTQQQKETLKAYFPGGAIPPGYLTGKT